MAPNIGSMEILLLAMLALAVLGPRDLPLLMRRLGKWMASARSMANEFRAGLEEMGREAEMKALQDEVNSAVMDASSTLDEIGDPDARKGDTGRSGYESDPATAEESDPAPAEESDPAPAEGADPAPCGSRPHG